LPEAERIAEKYGYSLPKISNQKYNDYLKLLGAGAGITKSLTSHVARHTFATYLINRNIPIESVSKALGHASIRQTQHYARLLGKKVIEDMKTLLRQD
jgi:site-specific recombinase XerD